MRTLQFGAASASFGAKRIREAHFALRSSLPVSAACVVANAMRETLATLVSIPVAVRLFEPVMPRADAWRAIVAGASLYRIAGTTLDAAIVLRPKDAVALASLLFGEAERAERDLSVIERTVVARAVQALAGALAPVCGFRETPRSEPILDIDAYATYFEVLVEQPVAARIGIALSRDPQPAPGARLRPADLLDVEIELTAVLAEGVLDAASLLALGEGTSVPMTSKVGDDGVLLAGTTVIARAECGAQGSRAAIVVRSPANGVLR